MSSHQVGGTVDGLKAKLLRSGRPDLLVTTLRGELAAYAALLRTGDRGALATPADGVAAMTVIDAARGDAARERCLMLAIVQFDAASARVLARLLDDGRLPVLAGLRDRGTWHDLDAPATQFAAGAQHTLYSGHPLESHGLFYPFQWSAAEQRARYMGDLYAPPPVWEQLGTTGGRTLAVDPYESRPPSGPTVGTQVCGWQLHDRVVLRRWDRPERHPQAPARHVRRARGGRRGLRHPHRHRDARPAPPPARRPRPGGRRHHPVPREQPYDLAWTTFCAAHVAGHQFWDLSQLDPDQLDDSSSHLLATTLEDVYAAVDTASGASSPPSPRATTCSCSPPSAWT